jgi:hypothetical protein
MLIRAISLLRARLRLPLHLARTLRFHCQNQLGAAHTPRNVNLNILITTLTVLAVGPTTRGMLLVTNRRLATMDTRVQD